MKKVKASIMTFILQIEELEAQTVTWPQAYEAKTYKT